VTPGRALLSLLFAASLALALWASAAAFLGTTQWLAVTSGHSMQPTLVTGEAAVFVGVAPADLRVGQIVEVDVPSADQHRYGYEPVIVHRIVGVFRGAGGEQILTRGDAQGPEPFRVPASAVTGRLVLAVPAVGWLVLLLHSRSGLMMLVALALIYLAYTVLDQRWQREAERNAGGAPG